MSHRSATWLLVLTAVLWSLGGVLLKSVEWHPMAKSGIRCAIAAVVVLVWLRGVRFAWSWHLLATAVAYALTLCLFVLANDMTTAANAIFLQYTAPIYVALLAPWFLGERAGRGDWAFIAVALVGIALFFRDGLAAGHWLGDVVGLGSGLAFAIMVMLMRWGRGGSPEAAMLLGNILVAVAALPFYFGKPPTPAGWLALGTLGVVQIGIPYLIYAVAIRRVTAMEAILIPTLEPILNPIWVALACGEMPGPWALAGAALVLVAVVGRGLMGSRAAVG